MRGLQIESDGLWAKSNVRNSRYVAVHPAGLYAQHASQLADCHVLVFHKFAPLKNSGNVKRLSLKYEGFLTDFLSDDSHFSSLDFQDSKLAGKLDDCDLIRKG